MTKQSGDGAKGNVFRLEEATIDELHRAIRAGETTCVEVVQHYINRVQAYNGVSRCTTRCSLSLSGDCTRYVSTSSYTPTKIPEPGLPFSLVFRADPGSEDVLLEIASAYEAASKRRVHRRHSAHFRLILNQ